VSDDRANRAVALGVREHLARADRSTLRSADAYAIGIGRRLARDYGAELAGLAEREAAMSPYELYRAVIVPGEWPWEAAADDDESGAVTRAREHVRGARDRARRRRAFDPDAIARLADLYGERRREYVRDLLGDNYGGAELAEALSIVERRWASL
jgi:hypothetical protein